MKRVDLHSPEKSGFKFTRKEWIYIYQKRVDLQTISFEVNNAGLQ